MFLKVVFIVIIIIYYVTSMFIISVLGRGHANITRVCVTGHFLSGKLLLSSFYCLFYYYHYCYIFLMYYIHCGLPDLYR